MERYLLGESLSPSGHKSIELKSLSDLRLMCQELKLLQFDYVCELQNDLLRVLAKLRALPSLALRGVV